MKPIKSASLEKLSLTGLKKPEIRFLAEIKNVLYDKKWAESAANFEVYYMYRNLKERDGLRYDVTIIPPRMLGEEFVKTKGHYHQGKYAEVYQVLEGEGLFLFQKVSDEKVLDVYAVRARKGEVVVVPPYYGHITINPSNKPLKMANWISQACKSNYLPIEEKGGACYFYTKSGWKKNKSYKKIPRLRFKKPLKTMPKNLDFLQ